MTKNPAALAAGFFACAVRRCGGPRRHVSALAQADGYQLQTSMEPSLSMSSHVLPSAQGLSRTFVPDTAMF